MTTDPTARMADQLALTGRRLRSTADILARHDQDDGTIARMADALRDLADDADRAILEAQAIADEHSEPDRGRVTGDALHGADRLFARYVTQQTERARSLEQAARTFADFNDMAGLGDDYETAANDIGLRLSVAQIQAMTAGAVTAEAVGEVLEQNVVVALPMRIMLTALAASYSHGMTLGSLAAIGVTAPDDEEQTP